ncbi:MAG TPA: type VI secretion system baseplate subunit TssK [Pseudomonadota bacterium]|jgi:type VI secretion system protein ImpJ|nr:type VI secretion system baseplate subunit TssK [Pseudomonadota bacterium]HNN51221.1 type VI secretion system baseplate subunit TssK [Pseudomonadota bacterium]
MDNLKLARVKWYLGQTLLPEQFVCQEQALTSDMDLRARLSGLPSFGIGPLKWNDKLLEEGVLAISALTAVLPTDGNGHLLIDVPGNAVVQPLSLKASGATRISIYLHVLEQTTDATGVRLYEGDPKVVQRVMYRALLSIEKDVDRSVAMLKLAELQKDATGGWSLLSDYLPPLLQVGGNPFLERELLQLLERLETLEPRLTAQLQDTFLRPDRLAVTRRTLAELQEVLSLLADMRHGVTRHPYYLFDALRRFYLLLCCYHEVLPEQSSLPYQHDALAQCLGTLLSRLSSRAQMFSLQSSHLKFVKMNGLFRLNALPDEVRTATEVYLLVQRPSVHDRVNIDEIKLACTSRLALVHRLVLKGIPFRLLERVHFQHSFGPEMDFYQLTLNEEWQHVLREGAIAFYQPPALEKVNAYLFWR